VLDVSNLDDSTYPSGRFGFYNFSEGPVRYSGFTRRTLPPSPVISVANRSVVEGNAGTTNLVFSVNLSQTNCEPTLVDYSITPGSATPGQDYTGNSSGTLMFAPGQTSVGDRHGQWDIVGRMKRCCSPSRAGDGDGRHPGVGTIVDDDISSDWSSAVRQSDADRGGRPLSPPRHNTALPRPRESG
jgi:hypothetical protein